MIIKICGITNLEDALIAVEAGADALGFNFFPRSPRYVAPEKAAVILDQIPGHILKVGVFVNESPEVVTGIVQQLGLDVAQLHGREQPQEVPPGLRVWKALRVGEDFNMEKVEAYDVEAFVLDAPAGESFGGTGRTFQWSQLPRLPRRFLVAGGLTPENVAEAIRLLKPWGVDAASKLESRPGKKDPKRIEQFIQAARKAWYELANHSQ